MAPNYPHFKRKHSRWRTTRPKGLKHYPQAWKLKDWNIILDVKRLKDWNIILDLKAQGLKDYPRFEEQRIKTNILEQQKDWKIILEVQRLLKIEKNILKRFKTLEDRKS